LAVSWRRKERVVRMADGAFLVVDADTSSLLCILDLALDIDVLALVEEVPTSQCFNLLILRPTPITKQTAI
jgi:hypothetical protein